MNYTAPYTEDYMKHRTSFLIGYKIGQLFAKLTIKPVLILVILCNALAQIIEVLSVRLDDVPYEDKNSS
jgi:hypothetical protein